MVMFVTMMIVMVMGNLLIKIEAKDEAPPKPSPFKSCFQGCLGTCALQKKFQFPDIMICPVTCLKTCILPQVPVICPPSKVVSTNEINHIDYYCKLGCATHHCASLSSIQNPSKFLFIYLL